ncbi:MAG TPA: SNF2-related protein, partial [Phnomibacter sp.]|nr:SNF2-related protein [Phnomibacter sp.]
MAGKSPAHKTILLLQPQRLPLRTPVVQLLKVDRRGTMVHMEEMAITAANLAGLLKQAPPAIRSCLAKFGQRELEKMHATLEKKLLLVKFGKQEAEAYRYKAVTRYYHELFAFLRRHADEIAWYHRLTQPGTLRVQTAPCTYAAFSVMLHWEAYAGHHGPALKGWVKFNGEKQPLEAFRRFSFLLEKEGKYYLMNLSTTEAMDWMDDQHLTSGTWDTERFVKEIVEPLRRDHQQTVDTEGLVPKPRLKVRPTPQVRLSELNNTFLMLTPQFVYEGYLVDGPWMEATEVRTPEGPLVIERDHEVEETFNTMLRGLHPQFAKQYNGYYYLSFAEAQKKHWFLNIYHQLLGSEAEVTGLDMLRHFRYTPHKASTTLQVLEREGDMLRVHFALGFGKEKVPLPELQKMLLAGQKVVMMKDGSMGVLGEEWLTQYAAIVKHGKIQGKQLLVPRWLGLGAEDNEDGTALRKGLTQDWLERWNKWKNEEQALYPVPAVLNGTRLRPYQQKGFDWMALLAEAGGSACLADDMGLGKTLQTICFMAHALQQKPGSRHLVVCPASLMYNWQQEFE